MTNKDREMNRRTNTSFSVFFILIFSIWALLLGPMFSLPSAAVPTHLDRAKIKKGCSACHKGHGRRGTTMLAQARDEVCFTCHGNSQKNPGDSISSDIYSVIMKSSSHPIIQTSHYHVPGETLTDGLAAGKRHVSCFDCHDVHKSEKGKALKKTQGYSGRGSKVKEVRHEYEICYNCHSDSGNPARQKSDISLDFVRSNQSYHPVETYGRNTAVRSLLKTYNAASLITCSDCHGNDDRSGPQGPHGSTYEPILKYRYVRTPGPESPSSYELCYACHDRTSILNDESFKSHKIHVVYNQVSCAQCHDAHGSKMNRALINFDKTNVFPNARGQLLYMPMAPGMPRCYLSCHIGGRVYEHKMDQKLTYTINNRNLPQW